MNQFDLFAPAEANAVAAGSRFARQPCLGEPRPSLYERLTERACTNAVGEVAAEAAIATVPTASPGLVDFAMKKLPGWMKSAAMMRRALAQGIGKPGDAARAHCLETISAALAREAAGMGREPGDRAAEIAGLRLQREAILPRQHPAYPDIVMHSGPLMAELRDALEARIRELEGER